MLCVREGERKSVPALPAMCVSCPLCCPPSPLPSSEIRALRHTAVTASLRCGLSLIAVVGDVVKALETAQTQAAAPGPASVKKTVTQTANVLRQVPPHFSCVALCG